MNPLSTTDLCDERKNDTDGAFRVLPPVFRDFGAHAAFSGRVATVKCHEDNTLVKAAVDSPMPWPTEKRNQGQADVPVQVQGVWVRPGEWLVADADGIVVMPAPPEA